MLSSRIARCALVTLLTMASAASAQTPTPRNGYDIALYATLPGNPTAMAVDDTGLLHCVTYTGKIYRIPAWTGTAGTPTLWFDGSASLNVPCTGLTWHDGKFYVAHQGTVSTIEDTDASGTGDLLTHVITGLPWMNDHQNNNIVFDENGFMYFGIGSQNDSSPDVNPLSGTIVRADANGSNVTVWATGVRNAYGIAYKQGFGLVCGDNGPNALAGVPNPPDEINFIVQGGDYGYPDYYGAPPAGMGLGTIAPAVDIPAHAAPTGMTFDHDRAFSGFENDLYVCLFAFGAGLLVRATLDENDGTGLADATLQVVASNFFNVIDCKFTPMGELVAADFLTKKLWRITPKDTSRIRIDGAPRVDSLMTVELQDQNEVGDAYICALSLTDSPGWPLPNGETWWMNVNDGMFQYSTQIGNPVLYFPGGFLDAQGKVTGLIAVPDLPVLEGFSFYIGFLSAALPSFQIGSVSETLPFTLMAAE